MKLEPKLLLHKKQSNPIAQQVYYTCPRLRLWAEAGLFKEAQPSRLTSKVELIFLFFF